MAEDMPRGVVLDRVDHLISSCNVGPNHLGLCANVDCPSTCWHESPRICVSKCDAATERGAVHLWPERVGPKRWHAGALDAGARPARSATKEMPCRVDETGTIISSVPTKRNQRDFDHAPAHCNAAHAGG